MEAEGSLFPVIKKWRTQKGFCALEPHRVLLGNSMIIKTTMRYHFTSTSMATTKKTDSTNVGKYVKKNQNSFTLVVGM